MMPRILPGFVLMSVLAGPAAAGELYSDCAQEIAPDDRNRRLLYVNLAGVGVITAWGVVKWDYFTRSPTATSERWFQNDTASGGADKLGHLYTNYVASHGLSYLFERWCFNRRDAALYGALSAFAITGYMELGDSFSDFGFSKEDFIANALGSLFGYALYVDPDLARKFDLRWEYGLKPDGTDFTTDYENSKYLIAMKFNGFPVTRDTFLKHFELHLGYYTRGFDEPAQPRERNLYLGIGLNLTDFFRRHSYRKTATFLNYFQLPETSLTFENDLN